MPASNAFTGFTKTGQNTFDKTIFNISGAWDNGWNFNNKITSPDATVYFPASGFRYSKDGVLYSVGDGGFYWSAIPHQFTGAVCNMNFGLDDLTPLNGNDRPFGFSVRPVFDE